MSVQRKVRLRTIEGDPIELFIDNDGSVVLDGETVAEAAQDNGNNVEEYFTEVQVDDGWVSVYLTKVGTLVFCLLNFRILNFSGNNSVNIHTPIIPEGFRPNITNRATGVQGFGKCQTNGIGVAGVPNCLIQLYNNGWLEIYKDQWLSFDAGLVSSEPGAIQMHWTTTPWAVSPDVVEP